jgi:primary-amine oxidase
MSTEQVTTGELRPDGTAALAHPLDQLTVSESDSAREVILNARGPDVAVLFRSIALEEPPKKELIQFLDLEHGGKLTAQTPRPTRLAKVQYDVIYSDKTPEYIESWVDVVLGKEVEQRVVDKGHEAALTLYGSRVLRRRVC